MKAGGRAIRWAIGLVALWPLQAIQAQPVNVADFFVVDCLLPGQVRRFGQMTQMTKPRPARIAAFECRLRGGKYVEYDRTTLQSSLDIWMPLARTGDIEAQMLLGRLNEQGVGSPSDHRAAADWYRRAADAGHGPAKIALGSLYERGLGVAQDTERALRLYRDGLGLGPEDDLMRRTEVDQMLAEKDQAIAAREAELLRASGELERLRSELRRLRSELQSTRDRAERLRVEMEETRLQEQIVVLERTLQESNAAVGVGRSEGGVATLPLQSSGKADARLERMGFGKFHALVVDGGAADEAQTAARLADTLRSRYGFSVETLNGPDIQAFLSVLEKYRKTLSAEDSFLLYFNGQSRYEHQNRIGYWQFADQSSNQGSFWLPHVQLGENLNGFPARRVLILSVGHFGTGTSPAPIAASIGRAWDERRMRDLAAKPARIAITGTTELMSASLIQALRDNSDIIDATGVYRQLTMLSGSARPTVSQFQPGAGGGQFFFAPVDSRSTQVGWPAGFAIAAPSFIQQRELHWRQ